VQAPKTRKPERERNPRLLLLIAAALAAAAIGAAAYFLLRGDGESSVEAAMTNADCTFRRYPLVPPGVHLNDPDATPGQWNSFPPTSGPHYGGTVIWGEYDESVQLAAAVHNLEHGGIVIYYGDEVPDDEVERVRDFYRDDPVGLILAPLPRLNDKITLTAWYAPRSEDPVRDRSGGGYLAECRRFDEDAFSAFRDAFRFLGPERVAPENMQPGQP
jgi:hypothetical protein